MTDRKSTAQGMGFILGFLLMIAGFIAYLHMWTLLALFGIFFGGAWLTIGLMYLFGALVKDDPKSSLLEEPPAPVTTTKGTIRLTGDHSE